MDKAVEALRARLVGTTRSVREIWFYVAIAASLISLFGSSAAQLKLFRVIVGGYRKLTTVVYDELEWPDWLNLAFLHDHPDYVQPIRDITTLVLTVAGIAAVKLYSEFKTYRTIQAALADNEKAAMEAISKARVQTQDDDSGAGAALAGGTLFGLILGGPIGALFGALAGGLFGLAASQDAPPEVPDPATVHSAVESELAAARTEAKRRLLDRLGFSLLVGTLVVVLDWNAEGLVNRLSEIDKTADKIVDGWVVAFAGPPKHLGKPLIGSADRAKGPISAPGIAPPPPATQPVPAAPVPKKPVPTKLAPVFSPKAKPASVAPSSSQRLTPVPPSQTPLASPARPLTRYIARPDWLHQPSDEDGQRLYPDAARRQSGTGKVTLDCIVNERGKLTDCAVTEESPAGFGFGRATLQLAAQYRMKPVDLDGRPTAGAHRQLRVTWDPPKGRP